MGNGWDDCLVAEGGRKGMTPSFPGSNCQPRPRPDSAGMSVDVAALPLPIRTTETSTLIHPNTPVLIRPETRTNKKPKVKVSPERTPTTAKPSRGGDAKLSSLEHSRWLGYRSEAQNDERLFPG